MNFALQCFICFCKCDQCSIRCVVWATSVRACFQAIRSWTKIFNCPRTSAFIRLQIRRNIIAESVIQLLIVILHNKSPLYCAIFIRDFFVYWLNLRFGTVKFAWFETSKYDGRTSLNSRIIYFRPNTRMMAFCWLQKMLLRFSNCNKELKLW